jgi:hypothetical protein
VLILSILCAVITLTAGFFATKGLMFGESDFAPNIAYGDELGYSAKAMFGKVQYEYRAEGETEWSTEMPTKPGNFYVRSAAKSGFGKVRYGEEHAFTIAPKALRVAIGENEILYGETPTVVTSGLAYTDTLSHNGLRYADAGKTVSKVAVGGGACSEYDAAAIAAGCDTFVTSDVTYHQFLDAKGKGINLIDAGHFPTEDPVCDKLIKYISEQFPELTVTKSDSHREVIQYYV